MVADIRKDLLGFDGMEKDDGRKIAVGPKKFTVTEVREKKKGFINPVLVSFQNGNLIDEKVSGFKVSLKANENGETNVEVESAYGHVFKDSSSSEISRPTQIIAIRNRKTNKVKIVEVDSALLINSALIHTPVVKEVEADYGKDLKTLHKTFGGKKVVIRLEQRDKLNVSSMPITDEVKKAVEDIKVETPNTSLNETETESILHLLPPCHRDATLVSDVYVLSEILSDGELEELKKEVDRLGDDKFNPKDFTEFSVECYAESKKTEGKTKSRLAGILFVEILIKFLKIPSRKVGAKRIVFCEFSSVIHEKLRNEFCVKTDTTVSRPMAMRDKLLCYIVAISLICCNYRINLKLLAQCTAINLTRLTRLARVVGAVPASKDDSIFILKVPLPALPKSSKGKRGPKK